MKAVTLAIAITLGFSVTIQAETRASGTEHSYFSDMTTVLETAKQQASSVPAAGALIRLATGKNLDYVIDHYKVLMKDVAKTIRISTGFSRANDVGSGANGYYAASENFDAKSIQKLEEFFPAAIKKYSESKPLSWDSWVALFGNDPQLAIKGILVTSGWVRAGIEDTASQNALHIVAARDSKFQPDPYASGSLAGQPWGLNLAFNGIGWGRAYKTVAGMNLALALWNKGYSSNDVTFAVSRAALVYEASDLLYDHLGKKRDGVFQCPDNARVDLQPDYDKFLNLVREKINKDPKILIRMNGELAGMPALVNTVGRNVFDTSDELKLTMLLLAYQYSRPADFMSDFESEFYKIGNSQDIIKLFYAGSADIRALTKGAEFVTEKLKGVSRSNAKFKGLLGAAKFADGAVESIPGLGASQVE